MGQHSTIEFTTGIPGSGKTLLRGPCFLIDEFFADDPSGTSLYISNLPLKPDKIAAVAAARYGGEARSYEERIVAIPEGELKRWREAATQKPKDDSEQLPGPWSFFHKTDLSGCRVQIDELHHYCGKSSSVPYRRLWQRWLGEARHMGVTIEGMTQNPDKVADEFAGEAAVRRSISHRGTDRDPIFDTQFGDWYELRAKFTGKYKAVTALVERRKSDDGWRVTRRKFISLDPKYFPLYDSYSAPQQGGGLAALKPKFEFEKRSWLGLLLWFFGRNFPPILKRTAQVAFVLWFGLADVLGFTGPMKMFTGLLKDVSAVMKKKEEANGLARAEAAEAKKKPGSAAAVRPAAVPSPAGSKTTTPAPSVKVPEPEKIVLTMVQGERFAFKDGDSYALGEKIDNGPFTGRRAEAIDTRRRLVRFDDGSILRLGVPSAVDWQPAAATTAVASSARPGGSPTTIEAARAGRSALNPLRVSDAAGTTGAGDRRPGGYFGGDVGRDGLGPRYSRSDLPADVENSGPGGPSIRR